MSPVLSLRSAGRALLLALLLCPLAALRAQELPLWLRNAARQTTPITPADTPAAVLLDETVLTVDSRGRGTWEHRYAVRILTRAGLDEAQSAVLYLDKKDSVESAKAWLIRAGKVAKVESDKKWYDLSQDGEGTLFTETRAKRIVFREEAVPDDIFASETKVEGPMLFAQDRYSWDHLLPTMTERYIVNVPAEWHVTPMYSGDAKPVASVSPDGRTWTWELNDRPYRPREPWPQLRSVVVAQVMVNLVAPNPAKSGLPRLFRTWPEEAAWEEAIAAGQCDTDPALAATASRLVADCADEVAKIRALTGYVQKLRYVAVDRDLDRGMGYRPRKATEVHAKGFGDCKDKSNLLRAMLREVGISSYPVAALSSIEREVSEGWPSPYQFNHEILAIQVGANVDWPTVVRTKQWGALLFFDTTDAETLVGDLPWYLQGTQVHVIAPGTEELIRLPILPVQRRWLTERRVNLALSPKGSVSGDFQITGFAQSGAQLRHATRNATARDLNDWATGRISATIRGASAQKVVSHDDALTGQFGLSFVFGEASFSQMMPGGLSIVRLDLFDRDVIPTFAEKERRTSVELRPIVQDDQVILRLPPGLKVEELPTKTILNSPYGSYENSFEAEEGKIVFRRLLKLNPVIVPVAEYAQLRQFLSNASKADRGAVVLRSVK